MVLGPLRWSRGGLLADGRVGQGSPRLKNIAGRQRVVEPVGQLHFKRPRLPEIQPKWLEIPAVEPAHHCGNRSPPVCHGLLRLAVKSFGIKLEGRRHELCNDPLPRPKLPASASAWYRCLAKCRSRVQQARPRESPPPPIIGASRRRARVSSRIACPERGRHKAAFSSPQIAVTIILFHAIAFFQSAPARRLFLRRRLFYVATASQRSRLPDNPRMVLVNFPTRFRSRRMTSVVHSRNCFALPAVKHQASIPAGQASRAPEARQSIPCSPASLPGLLRGGSRRRRAVRLGQQPFWQRGTHSNVTHARRAKHAIVCSFNKQTFRSSCKA